MSEKLKNSDDSDDEEDNSSGDDKYDQSNLDFKTL